MPHFQNPIPIIQAPQMPKRKFASKKRSTKRRRLFSRRRRIGTRGLRFGNKGPIAAKVYAKLKYNESFTSSGATYGNIINVNSIFDPNRSGGGHQPYGHDTYSSLYNRYRVVSMRYRIQIAALDTTVNSCYKATIVHNNNDVPLGNPSLCSEFPGSQTKLVMGSVPCVFKGVAYPNRITGVSRAAYKDDRYSAQFGANPSEIICQHLVLSTMADAIPVANVLRWNVVLVYTVEMYDPLDLAQS